jgi:hypothetical protein
MRSTAAIRRARRVRLASSPEIAANCLTLELRWIKLAEKAEATDRRRGPLGKVPAAAGARV